MVNLLAFDLGATSGRAVIGQYDQNVLTLQEIHRFSNDPVQFDRHLYWDILRIFHELKRGLIKSQQLGFSDLSSMGIDSWAVDFGLLGANGQLLGNPIHYRDDQTTGMMEQVFQTISQEEIFRRTGIQFMQINTLYHLYAMRRANSPLLKQANALLMIPDLLRYFFTGEKYSEFTNATTTQLFHTHNRCWDESLMKRLALPTHLFQSVVQPGTKVGSLRPSIQQDVGLPELPVIAVCEHDTASAVVSIPTDQEHFAYLSCGTWSLLGTEVKQPIINEQSLAWNFTNEGGFDGTYRLLKNIMGLWLVEECKRIWEKEGKKLSYQQMMRHVSTAPAFQSFIDPDDSRFLHPDHMPKAIQEVCRETNQPVPQSEGEILRCVLESLAFKYRYVLEKTEQLSGHRFSGLHMVGGGINNSLLCQFTSNAIGRPVWAGPVEGTAIGNLLVQLITLGKVNDIQEARQLVSRSFPIQTYEPQNQSNWQSVYRGFCQFIDGERR